MKPKERIPDILVIISGIAAVMTLAGFPSSFRITPVRLIFIFFTIMLGAFAVIPFRIKSRILLKKGLRSFVFHLLLAIILHSTLLIVSVNYLMPRTGTLYSIGSFLKQTRPFLIFLIILCVCESIKMVVLLYRTERFPLRILLSENRLVSEIFLVFIACALVYGAFIPLRDNYYPSHDSAIFAYFGQQILRGKMPYTELWDHKPPLIFYINALGLKLFNGSIAGIWLLEFLLFFFGAMVFLIVLKKHFPAWIALPLLFLGILHYVRVFDFGNYTEELSLFFVMCTLFIVFSGKIKKRNWHTGLAIGIFCGLAFSSKQNTIGCWSALFILDIMRFFTAREEDTRKLIVHFWLMAGLGFLTVNAAWVIYFACNGALAAYWDVAFRYNLIYSEHSTDNRLACAWTTLSFLPSVTPYLLLSYLSWIPAFIQLGDCPFMGLSPQFEKGKWGQSHKGTVPNIPLTLWALIDLPIELIFAGLSGMNYQHYFILCIPPAIILLCDLVDRITWKMDYHKWVYQTAIILALALSTLPLTKYFQDNYMHRTPSSYTKIQDYLLKYTTPDEPILVWGSRSAIYVMSERYAPTAYFNERPLYLLQGDIQVSQWDEFYDDITSDPPQVIIYTHDTALPFIEWNDAACQIPEAADYTKSVYQFFCENYSYETTINPEFYDAWDIYRRR